VDDGLLPIPEPPLEPFEELLPVPVPLLELGSEVPVDEPLMPPEDVEPVPVEDGLELLEEPPVAPFDMMSRLWTLRVSPEPE
jgi:hypothetical protein